MDNFDNNVIYVSLIDVGHAQQPHQVAAAAQKLKTISGPVYLTEQSGNHFAEFVKAVDSVSSLCGPVYMAKDSGRNVFNEIFHQVNKVKELAGPIYVNENMSHSYSEIQKHAEKLSNLSGPVYLDENNISNSFNVILKNAESLNVSFFRIFMTVDYFCTSDFCILD